MRQIGVAKVLAGARPAQVAVVVLLLAAHHPSSYAQNADPPLPANPHAVSHCDLPARAAHSGGKPCGCAKFVAEVQDKWAERCWRQSRFGFMPANPVPADLMPPDVRQCVAASPGHCQVIGKGVFYWNSELGTSFPEPPAGGAYNACQTSCYPNRCGCADGACAPHSQSHEH